MEHSGKHTSVPTFLSVLQASNSKYVYIYKIQSSWSGNTLKVISLYFCHLNEGSRELTIIDSEFYCILHNVSVLTTTMSWSRLGLDVSKSFLR